MFQKVLFLCYYLLFGLTPLVFTSLNHELFEYNKMIVVYFLTVVIAGTWLLKMIQGQQLIIKTCALLLPLGLFLIANIISTLTSIDPHTSLWGYYTRSNGGLLSIISYTILFWALISNFGKDDIKKFMKMAVFSGFLVSLYAVPEHFGLSPSCVLLYQQFNASCWVQDVQARVFATLGQPNWLGAYLGMLIFIAIYLYLNAKTYFLTYTYIFIIICMYLAFTFTFSRGSTLGLIAGFGVFGSLIGYSYLYSKKIRPELESTFKRLLIILALFLSVNMLFGSALTRFKLVNQTPNAIKQASVGDITQLENGGTESGQIRLIVWKGALQIFKHYPIFGSGVETFAYSYYQFRPADHNLVSEWDFLYNKAHNEYLNYLATTGMVGLGSYLLLIGSFLFWSIKYQASSIKKVSPNTKYLILNTCFLAAYSSYLVQNIFGFSVVIIALFFYLFPAMAFVYFEDVRDLRIPFLRLPKILGNKTRLMATVITVILTVTGLIIVARNWVADTLYAKGSNYADALNPGQAYNYLSDAVILNPGEPLYQVDLGNAAAVAAVALTETDTTLSARLKDEALSQTEKVLTSDPNNTSFLRTAIQTYYQLASLDPQYNQKTVETFDLAIKHAPTDAKLYYNKGLVLNQLQQIPESIEAFKQSINLKPNYLEARLTLATVYTQTGQTQMAIDELKSVLKLVPNNPDALAKLKEIGEK